MVLLLKYDDTDDVDEFYLNGYRIGLYGLMSPSCIGAYDKNEIPEDFLQFGVRILNVWL